MSVWCGGSGIWRLEAKSTSLEVLSCGEVQHASHLQVRHTHQKEQLPKEGSQTRTG